MVNRYLKNSKNIINLGLIIIWMCFIFLMSNQPAAASDSQSLGIINILSKNLSLCNLLPLTIFH